MEPSIIRCRTCFSMMRGISSRISTSCCSSCKRLTEKLEKRNSSAIELKYLLTSDKDLRLDQFAKLMYEVMFRSISCGSDSNNSGSIVGIDKAVLSRDTGC